MSATQKKFRIRTMIELLCRQFEAGAQLRRPGSWVGRNFVRRRDHRAGCEKLECGFVCRRRRRMTRGARRRSRTRGQEMLDHAVFQAVERYDYQPAFGPENLERRLQATL